MLLHSPWIVLRLFWRNGLLLSSLLGLAGCFSPLALDKAVIEYDKATTDVLSKQLSAYALATVIMLYKLKPAINGTGKALDCYARFFK